MRWILLHIACIALAMAAVSCGETHYDSRLCAADSIIDVRPDSALALLRSIGPGSLTAGDDRAYHALLITEARYKCYDSIPSTDTIDLAVGHFASSGDRLKLTRALIYKGAVLEELGNPTEAMRLYKQAEETALPSDFHSLGYVNLRMAELYRNAFAESELDIEKYKKAHNYFILDNDSIYQLKCLNNLGALYRASDMDSAYSYINKAIRLSKALRDTANEFRNYACLARAFEMDSLYERQKEISLYILSEGAEYVSVNDTYYDLCKAYSNLHKPDSAQYYFSKSIAYTNEIDASRVLAQVDMEEAKGNYREALRLIKHGIRAAHDIEMKSVRQALFYAEKEIDLNNQKIKNLQHEQNKLSLIGLIVFTILVATAIAIILYIRYKNNITLLADQLSQLKIDSVLQLEYHLKNEEKLSASVKSYINKAKSLTEIYHLYGNHPDKLRTKFLELLDNDEDKNQFWQVLKSFADFTYHDAVDNLQKNYPELNDQEVNFITMLLCGFSNVIISVYMGYKSPHYVYNKKKMIATKMKLSNNLDSFIEKMRN